MILKLFSYLVCVALFFMLVRSDPHTDYKKYGGPYVYGQYYEYEANWFIDCDKIFTNFDHSKFTFVHDCSDF